MIKVIWEFVKGHAIFVVAMLAGIFWLMIEMYRAAKVETYDLVVRRTKLRELEKAHGEAAKAIHEELKEVTEVQRKLEKRWEAANTKTAFTVNRAAESRRRALAALRAYRGK